MEEPHAIVAAKDRFLRAGFAMTWSIKALATVVVEELKGCTELVNRLIAEARQLSEREVLAAGRCVVSINNEAKQHATDLIRSSKATAISPRCVEIVIGRPSNRPDVTARRLGSRSAVVKRHARDDAALRIRRAEFRRFRLFPRRGDLRGCATNQQGHCTGTRSREDHQVGRIKCFPSLCRVRKRDIAYCG